MLSTIYFGMAIIVAIAGSIVVFLNRDILFPKRPKSQQKASDK